MKMYVPMLIAVAAFGLARADNPPAPAAAGTSTAAAAAPATPAAHVPPKAEPPWKMYTRNGTARYCREVTRENSRITETHCVSEPDYVRLQADTERTRETMLKGSNGCQPSCAK
jgi:hypothetical protein